MSHPVNDEILESISEKYEITACLIVGGWEVSYEGELLETFNTLKEAEDFINRSIQKEFEELPEPLDLE